MKTKKRLSTELFTKPYNIVALDFTGLNITSREYDLFNLQVKAAKKLSDEKRIVGGKLDPDKPIIFNEQDLRFFYSNKELCKVFGVTVDALKRKESNGRSFLYNACNSLYSKRIQPHPDSEKSDEFVVGSLVGIMAYDLSLIHI